MPDRDRPPLPHTSAAVRRTLPRLSAHHLRGAPRVWRLRESGDSESLATPRVWRLPESGDSESLATPRVSLLHDGRGFERRFALFDVNAELDPLGAVTRQQFFVFLLQRLLEFFVGEAIRAFAALLLQAHEVL